MFERWLLTSAVSCAGPAYKGFDASTLSNSELTYAQDHMRILCGLYGSLRPLDLIQPVSRKKYKFLRRCFTASLFVSQSTLRSRSPAVRHLRAA